MSAAVRELSIERVWANLEYAGTCHCATCGERAYCRGVNNDSRVCKTCLEFVHRCQPPNMRRRRAR